MAMHGTGFLAHDLEHQGPGPLDPALAGRASSRSCSCVCAIFAPWIAPYGFNQTRDATASTFPKLAPPSGEHWLGTNDQFYDICRRVIWGARTALEVVVAVGRLLGRHRRAAGPGVRASSAAGSTGSWCSSWTRCTRSPRCCWRSCSPSCSTDKLGSGIVAAALSLTAIYIPQYFRVVRNTTVSRAGGDVRRGGPRHRRAAVHDHAQVPVRQRRPVGAGASAPSTPPTRSAPSRPSASWAWASSPPRPRSGATT